MKKIFLWPSINVEDYTFIEKSSVIEDFFTEIYKPYKAIYLSRARHFFPLIFEYEGMKRNNMIFTQPYSSHCVLSNISLLATPSVIHNNDIDSSIIYHQYGNRTKVKKEYKNILIEDSVDSIFLDISKKEIFPNNGKYSILSLPKIMKLPFGAILLCKNSRDYANLKDLISKKSVKIENKSSIYSTLKKDTFMKEPILNEYKLLAPKIVNIEQAYNDSVKTVKKNVDLVCKHFNIPNTYLSRLPSNIILNQDTVLHSKFDELILDKYRYIYDYDKEICNKKILIPVHTGILWEKVF